MKLKRYILLSLILIFYSIQLFSQIELKLKDLGTYDVDPSQVPRIKAYLMAVDKDQNRLTLLKENLVIIEDNKTMLPLSVSIPDIQGWQEVVWKTKLSGFRSPNIVEFIAVVNSESGYVQGAYASPNFAKVLIRNRDAKDISEVNFGNTNPGIERLSQIIVNPFKGKITDNGESMIQIDSIVISDTSAFRYHWQGNEFNRKPPPLSEFAGRMSLVDLYFKPKDTKYYREKFTVFYENEMEESLILSGNFFELEKQTLLEVIAPNGGETLVPCEIYEIKWKGNAPGLKTIVEYSLNGGLTWILIAEVEGSSYKWTVPKNFTTRGKIRLRQDLSAAGSRILRAEYIEVIKISFDSSGSRLMAANAAGRLHEWNMSNYSLANSYEINPGMHPSFNTNVYGIEYFNGGTQFAAAYKVNFGFGQSPDSIAFFNVGQELPYMKLPLAENFQVKEMKIDSKRSFLALLPQFGNRLRLIDPNTGNLLRDIEFPYPVNAMDFNSALDQAAVYMLNGQVLLMSVPDFKVIKTIDVSDIPLILELALSPDGNLLGIGTKTPKFTSTGGVLTENFVMHLGEEKIIRSSKNTSSDPVGLEFSPTSNILVVGSKAQPQIAFWDVVYSEFSGTIGGTLDLMTDFAFSPEGHSVAVSSKGFDNLVIRTFTYPERDESDSTFRIVEPKVDLVQLTIDSAHIASYNEYFLRGVICNTGEVPFTFNDSYFLHGRHFQLIDKATPLVITPGGCIDVKFSYIPLDTGFISDSLIFDSYCMGKYYMKIETRGLKRNLTFLTDVFNFGDVCVTDSAEKRFEIFRNDDPVPVFINALSISDKANSPFTFKPDIRDTVLGPGETLSAVLVFKPVSTGIFENDIIVYHSNQDFMIPTHKMKGKGIGAILSSSHGLLLFIPEIDTRILKVENRSDFEVTLTEHSFSLPDYYELLTPLPVSIPAGGVAELSIKKLESYNGEFYMGFKTEPCAADLSLALGDYTGESDLSIPIVEADPRGKATIPIIFNNIEKNSYKGIRIFEAEIKLNPRLFFPEKAVCPYGDAEIIRNEVVNDERIIGIRVNADFPQSGLLVEIQGVAGIAEVDETPIVFIEEGLYFGTAVTTRTSNGLLKLINIVKDRKIIHNPGAVSITNIMPNPASDLFDIEFESKADGIGTLGIYDTMGNLIKSIPNVQIKSGFNTLAVPIAEVPVGNYRVSIIMNGSTASSTIVIMK